jgi:hypothetical protein
MTQDQMLLTMAEYFRGERYEAWILAMSAMALALAGVALLWAVRDTFAFGLAPMLMVGALILATTAGTILIRDPGLQASLAADIANPTTKMATMLNEQQRISRVLSDFRLYTKSFLGLGVLAIALLLVVQAPIVRGIAAGLLVMMAAQSIIDHYGDTRAKIYAARLEAFAKAR